MRSTIASWLNILQNHARQKQAELAQTPPQRRRTSNVAHARSWRASNGTCSKKVGKKKMLQKAPAGWWRPLAPGDAGALRVPATFPGTAQLDDAVARGAVVAAYCGDACAHPPGPVA